MKNRFVWAALLLCILVWLATFPVLAEDGTPLQIQEASYDPETGLLSVSWTSAGTPPVTEAEFRVNPLDAEGNPLVIGEGYVEDILLEERVVHASFTAEPGQAVSASFQIGADYPGAVSVNVAVDRVVRTVYAEDGTVQERTVQELPDDRLRWFSSGQNAYLAGPENESPYEVPAEDVLAAAGEVQLGISVIPVPGELAEAYGFAFGGMMIVSVEEDSAAEAVGMAPGDLIYSVNGRKYAEEPYFIALGLADLAAGQPVTIQFERDNELWEVSFR